MPAQLERGRADSGVGLIVSQGLGGPQPCRPQKVGLQPESTSGPPACVPALHAHVWGTLQVGGRET